jgi:CHAD domain-containing protein
MRNNRVNKIVKKHFKTLKRFSGKILTNFDEETIHDFRVEYKKMRALLRMKSPAKEVHNQFKPSGQLKKWYQIAGALRDLQLQRRCVIELTAVTRDVPKKYLAEIQVAIKKVEKKMTGLPAFTVTGESEITMNNDARLDPFIKYNCSVIKAIINQQHFTDSQIHQIRKSLKDIFYAIRGLADTMDEIVLSTGMPLKKEMNYFETLLDELGEFQNKSASLHFYDPEWTDKLDTPERQTVNRLIDVVTKEKLATKQALMIHFEQEFPVHLDLLCESDFDELIAPGKDSGA